MIGATNFCSLPYDPEWRALKWAKENCPSYITNSAPWPQLGAAGNINYFFADREDLTLFTLKWKTNGQPS